jgi:lysophospholipase L1-like esterase
VYNSLQPGDFVTIQFGHNDICPITDQKARGVIPGTKDTLHVYRLDNGTYEVVYSFGWYLKKMIDDCREKGKPVVFFTGDSTVKNADKEDDGMWGWASQAQTVFDESKITLVNAARAGRSTRSFIREGLWEKVYNSLQPGDFVTIQFGHNDICPITDAKARGVIAESKDTLHVYKLDNGTYEVVYSFGWYLKKMIDDCREKGATPILVSLTPRNEWPGGKIERRDGSYGKWYREVVEETGVEFIDLHNISADFLDKKFAKKRLSDDKEKAKAEVAQIKEKAGAAYFKKDHTHTSKLGAQMNAQSFAKGLKANNSQLAKYLKK